MKTNKTTYAVVFALAILLPMVVGAKEIQQENKNGQEQKKTVWACKSPYSKEKVLWLAEWGGQSYVKVFDEEIPAQFALHGIEKRWDWGANPNHKYDYSIKLRPDQMATYYDFSLSESEVAKPRATYECKSSQL